MKKHEGLKARFIQLEGQLRTKTYTITQLSTKLNKVETKINADVGTYHRYYEESNL